MAKDIIETWVCDITGEPAVQEEFFAIGTDEYEIDLSEDEDKKYWEWAGYYIKRARLRPRKSEPSKTSSKDKAAVQVNPIKVRAWCKHAGVKVNSHGKIPQGVVNAFLIAYTKEDFPEECR